METNLSPKQQVLQMLMGYTTTQAIIVACQLEIADALSNGQLSIDELADITDTDPDSLYRLMRTLSSIGIFRESEDKFFSLTTLGECLGKNTNQSIQSMAKMVGGGFYQAWGNLLYSVKTGNNAFDKAHGVPVFEYLTKNPELGKHFDAAMTDFHGDETQPMIDHYDFSVFERVVDIGGGNGSVLAAILNNYPNVSGVLFDLAPVIERSKDNLTKWGLSDRCDLVGGNFFESVCRGGDAYILRHIVHDWQDQDAITILSNCRKAMNHNGKILVVESVIPNDNSFHSFKWLDLSMLLIGGKERTKGQYQQLFNDAGLKISKIISITHEMNLIEGVSK